ncbi:hypothetical protein ACFX2C_028594 [Malus domestica]
MKNVNSKIVVGFLMENVGSEAIDDGFLMDDEFLMENVDLFLASSIVKLAFAEEKSCDLEHGKMVSIQQSGSLELYASFLILFDLHIICALAWYFSVTIVDSAGTGTVLCAIVLPKVSYPKKSFGKYVKILLSTAPSAIITGVTENFNLQCYICSIERKVPKTYVISRFCDIVHFKNCKADGCRCSMIDINGWSRELNYGVYCMGSVAKYAFKSLKYSFKGNSQRMGKTNECNIELLKINKSVKFEEADDVVLLAMLVSSFRIGIRWNASSKTVEVGFLMENACFEAVNVGFLMKNADSEAVYVGFLMENASSEAIDDEFLMDDGFLMENADSEAVDNGLLMENAGFEELHIVTSSKVKLAFAEEKSCDLEQGKMVSVHQSSNLELYASFFILFDLHIVYAFKVSETIVDSAGTGTILCAIVLPKGNCTLADLVEVVVYHLKYEITKNFNLQCYICSIEREVPKAYVISRFCDIVHIKNCKADGCRCLVIDINCWSRELNYGVYCMGRNSERIGKTNECIIELLKIKKSVKFEEAGDVMLLAMLVSSFRIVSCGAPSLVSRIPVVGESDLDIHDFLPILFSGIGKSDVDGNGFVVVVLGGDYVLHFLKLIDGNCMKNVLTLFDPLTADQEVPKVHLFCLNAATLRFGKLDMMRIEEREDHGINYPGVNDMEYVFLGLPTNDFLDSLIEVGAETLLQ